MGSLHLFWISDAAWTAVEPHLPHGKPGKPRLDDRVAISGILHIENRVPLAGCACLETSPASRWCYSCWRMSPRRLLAGKACDADNLRNWLRNRQIKAVTPSTASRRTPYPLDREACRRRNVIEGMFCKLRNWRRIASRYDRLAARYLAALALVFTVIAWT